MKNIGSNEIGTLRRQLAQALRRMRTIKRQRLPFDEVLLELAAIKEQFDDALQYVNISLRHQNDASGQAAFSFSLDKHLLRRAAMRIAPRTEIARPEQVLLPAQNRAAAS